MIRRYCEAGACRNLATSVVKYSMPYGTPATGAACSEVCQQKVAGALLLGPLAVWHALPPLPKVQGALLPADKSIPHLSSSQAMVFDMAKEQHPELWGDA